MADKRISIRLEIADFKALLKISQGQDLTISQIVRKMIREALRSKK